MSKKRSRLRGIGRWGMYVSIVLLLIAIPISIFVQPELVVRHDFSDPVSDVLVLRVIGLKDGRIVFNSSRYSSLDTHDFTRVNKGWSFDVYTGLNPSSLDYVINGLIVPWTYRVSPSTRWEVSLMYPVFLIVGCFWLLAVDRKHKACRMVGRCSKCGYCLDGLNDGVCPECGDGVGSE